MKHYFNPVTYPVTPENPTPKKADKPPFPSAKDFEGAIAEIRVIIQQLQDGTSGLCNYAIHLTKGSCPAISALDHFARTPTEEGLKTFLNCSKQDFTIRPAVKFANILGQIYPKAEELVTYE